MPEFADDLFSIDVIGFVKKYCRSHQKKNPISVSTDGVLGRPNNWRSLDSRAPSVQILCQNKLPMFTYIMREKPYSSIKQVILSAHFQLKKTPARLANGGYISRESQITMRQFSGF